MRKLFKGRALKPKAGPVDDTEFKDRRRFIRLKKLIGVVLQQGVSQHKASIIDMCVGGLRVETRSRLDPQEPVLVSPLLDTPGYKREGVKCRIAWSRNIDESGRQVMGVSFQETDEVLSESWLTYVMRYSGFSNNLVVQRRKWRRVDTRIRAEAATGERMIYGTIVNLSLGGAAIELLEEVPKQLLVLLTMGPFRDLKPVHIHGRILHGRLDPNDHNRFIFGMQFVNPAADQKQMLREYLRALYQDASKVSRAELPGQQSFWGMGEGSDLPEPGFHSTKPPKGGRGIGGGPHEPFPPP